MSGPSVKYNFEALCDNTAAGTQALSASSGSCYRSRNCNQARLRLHTFQVIWLWNVIFIWLNISAVRSNQFIKMPHFKTETETLKRSGLNVQLSNESYETWKFSLKLIFSRADRVVNKALTVLLNVPDCLLCGCASWCGWHNCWVVLLLSYRWRVSDSVPLVLAWLLLFSQAVVQGVRWGDVEIQVQTGS